jgi:predicted metallo-beta-lactamase superfamily hydrolase
MPPVFRVTELRTRLVSSCRAVAIATRTHLHQDHFDIYWHLYEPLDEIASDRLDQLITDAIAHRERAERGLEL